MQGLTETVAACKGVILEEEGSFKRSDDVVEAWVRQVPKDKCRIIALSPLTKSFTDAPVEMISTTPSLPGTAIGFGVPKAVVKFGLLG